eukprot:CAMPEP_0182850946 /NCGR_PEP_ID=MMETSP0006_2-20121128/30367_1 /TAXON_ID=97485 /ORGANISM="Prymnesium parvum, Strain Texoma1" /LENGTH=49 /DNA_ID= /DNA_START= /DNA_END= /DNA_ORIENTATION=
MNLASNGSPRMNLATISSVAAGWSMGARWPASVNFMKVKPRYDLKLPAG